MMRVAKDHTAGSKACRLQLKNAGAWKILSRFDAADGEQTSLVQMVPGTGQDAEQRRPGNAVPPLRA